MNSHLSTTSDAELVQLARGQDRAAFGEIYDRYADDIYTFCRSRLRNEADAGDAMQETFVRATTRLGQLREPEKLRSWLFAIARNQIIATGKQAARATGGDDMGDVIDLRPDVDDDLLRAEASAELWDAAKGLSDRDQDVLELHVRHGLTGQALADAMGVSESHANVLVSRMKDRIATSLGSLLVARGGREECDELDLLLTGWDGRFTIEMRSKITRHVRACEVCERTQGAALAAGAFMLPVLEVPAGLRTSTIEMMSEAAHLMSTSASGGAAASSGASAASGAPLAPVAVAAVWEWRPDGFPYPEEEAAVPPPVPVSSSVAWLTSAAAFVLVVLLGAGAWFVLADRNETTVAVAGVSETNESTTVPATTSDAPETTAEPVEPEVAEAVVTTSTPTADDGDEVAAPTSAPADETSEPEPEVAAPTTDATTTVAPTTTAEPTTTTAAPTTTEPPTTTAAPSTTAASTTTESAPPTTEPPPPTTEVPPPSTETPPPSTETPPPTTETPPPTTEEPPPTTEEPNRAPFIRSVDADPLRVTVSEGNCRGGRTQLVVEVVDDGQIVSVVASWSPAPGSFSEVALRPTSDTQFTASVGPWEVTGPQTIFVVVTDDRGATASGQDGVRVTACGIGGLTG